MPHLITATQCTRIRRAIGARKQLLVRVDSAESARTLAPLIDAVLAFRDVDIDQIAAIAAAHRTPLIIDGGLTADTVVEALTSTAADGVAVDRGVTDKAGRKDRDKCAAFIAATEPVFIH